MTEQKERRRFGSRLSVALFSVICLLALPLCVSAADDSVQYLDVDGTMKSATPYGYVDDLGDPGNGAELYNPDDGHVSWYVLKGEKTFTHRVRAYGDVHLILCDGAAMTVQQGLELPSGSSLTIYAQSTGDEKGQLTGGAPDAYAALGGNADSANGAITINGGFIDMKGGKYAAGIGAGDEATTEYATGDITINGGYVFGTGGEYGAGIGSGDKTAASGKIIINGGEVHGVGGYDAAGIGGGNSGSAGEITINGGYVYGTGGTYGAGIGGGDEGNGGVITINGGNVSANSGGVTNRTYGIQEWFTSQAGGAGIGGGRHGNAGSITITGGNVTAQGKKMGAGIGNGGDNNSAAYTGGDSEQCKGGVIRISGGKIEAFGKTVRGDWENIYHDGGAGIGSGAGSFGCLVEISGGDIWADVSCYGTRYDGYHDIAGEGGAAIGNGYNAASMGIVSISGTVKNAPTIYAQTMKEDAIKGGHYKGVVAIGAVQSVGSGCQVRFNYPYAKVERGGNNAPWVVDEVPDKQSNERRGSLIQESACVRITPCGHEKKKTYVDEIGHAFECPYCYYQTDRDAHVYEKEDRNDHYHWKICSVCDYKYMEAHVYDQEGGKCSCGLQGCTITFKPGEGAEGEMDPIVLGKYTYYKLPGPGDDAFKFERKDMQEFLGWRITSENDSKLYERGENISIQENMEFTAVWGYNGNTLQLMVNDSIAKGGEAIPLETDIIFKQGETAAVVTEGTAKIDLNGHTIDHNQTSPYSEIFKVSGSGSLEIIDSAGGGRLTNCIASAGQGGAVTVTDGGTFTLSGGTITGNVTRYGGGVYVDGGTFNMTGGEISGNLGSFNGSGVYVGKGGIFNVSGSPVIYNNKEADRFGNVYLDKGARIHLTGALDATAKIGFKTPDLEEGNLLVVTDGLKENGNVSNFVSDNKAYYTGIDENGELAVGPDKATIKFDANNGTTQSSRSITVLLGTTVTLPACNFTPPEGKIFAGWEIGGAVLGEAETYVPDAKFTHAKATWTDKSDDGTHSIIVEDQGDDEGGSGEEDADNGSSASASRSTAKKGDRVHLNARARRGYRFAGWKWDWDFSLVTKKQALKLNTMKLLAAANDTAVDSDIPQIDEPDNPNTFLIMGDYDVIITAVFEKIEVKNVTLNRSSLEMAPGESKQLYETVTPVDADAEVSWSSDDESIVQVDNGTITALKAGQTTVTVSAGEGDAAKTASCTVLVTDKFEVTFDTDGGSEIAAVSVRDGAAVARPDDPFKLKHDFAGWRLVNEDGSVADTDYDFDAEVRRNLTLKAIWNCNHEMEAHPYTPYDCDTAGNAPYWECTICGKVFADEAGTMETTKESMTIAAGHHWGNWEKYNEQQHQRTCSECYQKERKNHEWDAGKITKKPAAGVPGEFTYTCTVCGAEKKVEINKETFDVVVSDDGNGSASATAASGGNGTRVTVKAAANAGYEFDKWEVVSGGVTMDDADSARTKFTIRTSDVELKACFKAHELEKTEAKDAGCEEDGNTEYWKCTSCGKFFADENGTEEIEENSWVLPAGHDWGEWVVTKEATATEEGVETRTCKRDKSHTETRVIPKDGTKPEDDQKSSDGQTPSDNAAGGMGADGTPVGKGADAAVAEQAIINASSDEGPAGTKFAPLKLKSTKQSKKAIALKWTKVKGASKYVIYGNLSGKKNKMTKLATATGTGKNISKIAGKKLKKGKYYKFIVVALDSSNKVVSTSKVVHAATKGGKAGNYKKVTVKSSVLAKAKKLKAGKKLKLQAKAAAAGSTVKKLRAVTYESSNPAVASVSKKGVVRGVKKGKCYIYAYAQNGVCKKIKVTVK